MSYPGTREIDRGEAGHHLPLEQNYPLLTTKLFLPPDRTDQVVRPRLSALIQRGLDVALVLVSAPAGYGKTTLVSSWLRETGVASAWLSLDEGDNDPIRFLQYFLAALQNALPGLKRDLQDVLLGLQPAPINARIDLLINAIAGHAQPFVLVLDDFHTIHAGAILEMLTDLLEHQPPKMHLVIITRTDPSMPLSRLRARNQLVDIRAQQLRFTPEETSLFLNEAMGLKLTGEEVTALEARTEGWIAGLQLAAIAMKSTSLQESALSTVQQRAFISAFSGSEAYIMDYLVEEVLKQQPGEVSSFLLQTSILDRLCGPLCDAVIDDGRKTTQFGSPNYDDSPSAIVRRPSSAVLESLARANLFLIPLDSEGRWYRYHHLFADVLNRRMEHLYPAQLPELHQRASRWYETNDLISDAIRHACLAGDWQRATQLVEQNGCQLLMRGEVTTLLMWIEAVEDRAHDHPWLSILLAWALMLTGHLERVEGILTVAEEQVSFLEPSYEVRVMLGTSAAARAQLANLHGQVELAATFARQALDTLPDEDPLSRSIRGVSTSILGDASWMRGRLSEARQAYSEAVQIGQAAGNPNLVMIANSNLAEAFLEGGQLHQAARLYKETIRLANRPDGLMSPLADRAYAGLSSVLYEWNQLDEATQSIQQCMELCRRWGNMDLLAASFVKLARLEQARCNLDRAQAALQAAEGLVDEYALPHRRTNNVKSATACFWLVQGKPERAADLARQNGLSVHSDEISFQKEPEYLVLLRLLLAQGNDEEALALSGCLLQNAQAEDRMRQVIKILVLQALVYQGMKESSLALANLERALTLARPEGYVRTFLDEGKPMARLLYLSGSDYAAKLLSIMSGSAGKEQPPVQLLIEPLTQRELEVLALIEAGCSNQEISEKLVISIATVKRHISNIYTKLGASSRTQAISRGKELKLFT